MKRPNRLLFPEEITARNRVHRIARASFFAAGIFLLFGMLFALWIAFAEPPVPVAVIEHPKFRSASLCLSLAAICLIVGYLFRRHT